MRRELSAGLVLVRRMHGRPWIAAVRPRGKPEGTWALPKGLIGPGETPQETALREGWEETGVRARLVSKLGDIRYVYTWEGERVFKIVSFYLARATGGRIGDLPPGMEIEVAEAGWLPLADAPRLLAYRGEREMSERALEILVAGSDPTGSDPVLRHEVGRTAARRALHVEGEPVLTRAPLIVDLEPRPSIAAGESRGPGEWLRRALPAAELVRLGEDDAGAPEPDGRQLVVIARDAHRHAWQRETLDALLAQSDDAIVVEVGLPTWLPGGGRGYVATYGAARVNLDAAAEILAGRAGAGLYSRPRRGVEQSGSSPGS